MSTTDHYWALPDGISEALPEESWRLEILRRELLDLYATWGYQLVMPPLAEYMQSLTTGLGSHLDVQTFKVTDQLTGRMMGIRADMTPQIARIDAHQLKTDLPNRLCYIGSVLRTRAFHEDGSRSPMQVGAELFGHAGADSDFEVISLLLTTLEHCSVPDVTLDIGHVGIFRGLMLEAGLSGEQEQVFYDMLERKSLPEVDAWLAASQLPDAMKAILHELPRLYGSPAKVLERAASVLKAAHPDIRAALQYVQQLAARLQAAFPTCKLHLDLTELPGYDYHTGVVYAAYTYGSGREIARGGRYDGIGKLFGRARPATGFSTDLRLLAGYADTGPSAALRILAPADADPVLEQLISSLRQSGHCVLRQLDGAAPQSPAEAACTQQIVYQDNQWIVTDV